MEEVIQNDALAIDFTDASQKKVILYNCNLRILKYLGQNNTLLNEIKIITHKIKLDEIEITEINKKPALISSFISGGIGVICFAGLFFPPLELVGLLGITAGASSSLISFIVYKLKEKKYNSLNSFLQYDKIKDFIDESSSKYNQI